MSTEKQLIEEMAKVIKKTEELALSRVGAFPSANMFATDLYNIGYRKQEWISVDDRLPQTDEKYLVYTSGGRIYTSYYYITNTYGFEFRDVTHWMPLPEAPKMKGGAE